MAFSEKLRIIPPKAIMLKITYNNKNYCFTDYNQPLIFLGDLYEKENFTISDIQKSSGNNSNNEIKIETNINMVIADLWKTKVPKSLLSCEIRECFIDSITQQPMYLIRCVGEISGMSTRDEKVTFTVIDNSYLLQVPTLSYTFSAFCSHSVYDRNCELNINDWSFNTTITDISSNNLVLTLEHFPENYQYFKGGIITNSGNDRELIMDVNAENMTIRLLDYQDFSMSVGSAIRIAPNCLGRYDNCKNLFNNIDNFWGFIKVKNSPFEPGGLK